jgi:O-antigen/teichoic acid export membrane protein
VLKHIIIYTPARIIPAVIGLLNLGVFTRVLGPEQYGEFAVAISITFTLDAFCGQWLTGAVTRFYASQQSEDDRDGLLASTGLLYLVPSALVCLVGATLLLNFWSPGTEQSALLLALPYFFVYSLQQVTTRAHMAALNSARFAVLNMLQAVLSAAISCALIIFLFPSPALAVFGIAVGVGVVLLADWPTTRRLFALGKARKETVTQIVHFAWAAIIGAGLALISARLNRFMLLLYAGAGAVGVYNAAQALAEQAIASVFMIIAMAAFPITVMAQEQDTAQALESRLRSNAIWIFGLGLPSAAGLAAVAPEMANLFLGEQFRSTAIALTPLLSAGAFINGVRSHFVIHSYLLAKKLHFNLYVSGVTLILATVTNYLLIPQDGVIGAAIAVLLTEIIALAFAFVLTFHAQRLPIPGIEIGKIFVATGGMVLALYTAPQLPTIVSLMLKLALGIVAYAILALALNVNGLWDRLSIRLKSSIAPQFMSGPHSPD